MSMVPCVMAASDVVRSYKLPDELDEWGQWVADNPGADTGMWMLKNNKQVRLCLGACATRGLALAARPADRGHPRLSRHHHAFPRGAAMRFVHNWYRRFPERYKMASAEQTAGLTAPHITDLGQTA